ncbi:MAG: hypothetical protein GF334_01920 [Candidatus Altiarchaeales archaeon]|nr:hypothetical protein [Candidatus Altiarchaeales archaeon]
MTTEQDKAMHIRQIRTLRAMAWERAKGELQAMLQTFWDEYEKFEVLDDLIKQFIKEIEDDELYT